MELNLTTLYEKFIKMVYSHRDLILRECGKRNIFIGNLDNEIDHKAMHKTFSSLGTIFSSRVVTYSAGHTLGYGFVQYAREESSQKAVEKLIGMF